MVVFISTLPRGRQSMPKGSKNPSSSDIYAVQNWSDNHFMEIPTYSFERIIGVVPFFQKKNHFVYVGWKVHQIVNEQHLSVILYNAIDDEFHRLNELASFYLAAPRPSPLRVVPVPLFGSIDTYRKRRWRAMRKDKAFHKERFLLRHILMPFGWHISSSLPPSLINKDGLSVFQHWFEPCKFLSSRSQAEW